MTNATRDFERLGTLVLQIIALPVLGWILITAIDLRENAAGTGAIIEGINARLARVEIALEKERESRVDLADVQTLFTIRDYKLDTLDARLDRVESAVKRGVSLPEDK